MTACHSSSRELDTLWFMSISTLTSTYPQTDIQIKTSLKISLQVSNNYIYAYNIIQLYFLLIQFKTKYQYPFFLLSRCRSCGCLVEMLTSSKLFMKILELTLVPQKALWNPKPVLHSSPTEHNPLFLGSFSLGSIFSPQEPCGYFQMFTSVRGFIRGGGVHSRLGFLAGLPVVFSRPMTHMTGEFILLYYCLELEPEEDVGYPPLSLSFFLLSHRVFQ